MHVVWGGVLLVEEFEAGRSYGAVLFDGEWEPCVEAARVRNALLQAEAD